MATVTARASRALDAPTDRVMAFLRDYQARPQILTENYTAYRVESQGEGGGTLISYHFAAGGRERDYRLQVEETDGALHERDQLSSFVSTWMVEPAGTGSRVTLEASWQGGSGIGGFFEGIFAPMGLRRIYSQVLERLAAALGS